MALHQLTIGQAAEAAGLTRKAVRVYEARGLLPSAERSTAGYQLYDQEVIELLTFIRRARTLGLHLDDIREVLAIRDGGIPCDTVRDLLEDRIAEIDATVTDLLALRKTLTDTRQRADDCTDDKPRLRDHRGLITPTARATCLGHESATIQPKIRSLALMAVPLFPDAGIQARHVTCNMHESIARASW